jgi:hypothetical protein
MKATNLKDMETAIKGLMNPFTYKVFTRFGDVLGHEYAPVGMIFILWRSENGYAEEHFDMSWLQDPNEKSPEYIIQNFNVRQKTFMSKAELIFHCLTMLRVSYYSQDSGTFSNYWRECVAQWVAHLEGLLNFDVTEKAKGQAQIQNALDSVTKLAWWLDDKDYRMAQAFENEDYHLKMQELKDAFLQMWKTYESQDWTELNKKYKK